jgi:hypothetical protein
MLPQGPLLQSDNFEPATVPAIAIAIAATTTATTVGKVPVA